MFAIGSRQRSYGWLWRSADRGRHLRFIRGRARVSWGVESGNSQMGATTRAGDVFPGGLDRGLAILFATGTDEANHVASPWSAGGSPGSLTQTGPLSSRCGARQIARANRDPALTRASRFWPTTAGQQLIARRKSSNSSTVSTPLISLHLRQQILRLCQL